MDNNKIDPEVIKQTKIRSKNIYFIYFSSKKKHFSNKQKYFS